MWMPCQRRVLTRVHAVQAVLSALTSFQFIVIPVASYALLGEEVTCTALICIVVVLFGAWCLAGQLAEGD